MVCEVDQGLHPVPVASVRCGARLFEQAARLDLGNRCFRAVSWRRVAIDDRLRSSVFRFSIIPQKV
jgi:hypothetical protein